MGARQGVRGKEGAVVCGALGPGAGVGIATGAAAVAAGASTAAGASVSGARWDGGLQRPGADISAPFGGLPLRGPPRWEWEWECGTFVMADGLVETAAGRGSMLVSRCVVEESTINACREEGRWQALRVITSRI